MMEDCATDMSASQGGIDETAVVESFKEALTQRIGSDRFRMWFAEDVVFEYRDEPEGDTTGQETSRITQGRFIVAVKGQFALQRLRQNFIREIRAAAAQTIGHAVEVTVELIESQPAQIELPLNAEPGSSADSSELGQESSATAQKPSAVAAQKSSAAALGTSSRRQAADASGDQSITELMSHRKPRRTKRSSTANESQPLLPSLGVHQSGNGNEHPSDQVGSKSSRPSGSASLSTFISGDCNQLALTATRMVCEHPGSATPLFLSGPTGVGKSHLLQAIADEFRRRYRMRRVIRLSAETFTNDFITSVSSSGLPAFRRRYREVDALLVDDVQFLGSKRATLREMLYTVETLGDARRPLVFTGSHAPSEIAGLTPELAGRLASGLVCPLQQLSASVRETLLRQLIEQRCTIPWPDRTVAEVNLMLVGDGRIIHGIVNLVDTLQRMYERMPTMDEIRQHGGQLLRSSKPAVTLSTIEQAVAQTFQLPSETLRSHAKTRSISEPRMLAMYLSRELTSSAYSEIGRHYGGRSHSTALVASQKVKNWLQDGKSVGRGAAAVSAREALERIEGILRSG
jgi:chromosomal replication initiator protein